MTNPFSDFKAAFIPFFDIPVAVEGLRENGKVAGTFMACVFDNGFAAPFTDTDVDSTIRTYSISIMAGDWLEKLPPQVGDKIMVSYADDCTPNLPNINLAVSHIDSLVGDIWTLTAKEVQK